MKWLKDDSYNAMKQAADNWDKLLNKVLGDNPDMKAEDVTVDQLLDSIESTGNTSDLQEQLSTAQEKLKENTGRQKAGSKSKARADRRDRRYQGFRR